MKTKIFQLLSIFVAIAMLSGVSVKAQNQAILDALVKKGCLTAQEATEIANETVIVKPNEPSTKTLSVSGLIHSQYDYVATKNDVHYEQQISPSTNPKSTNRFRMRRVDLGATAQLGNGWSGVLNCRVETLWWRSLFNMLETAYVQKDVQGDVLNGSLRIGHQKVSFIREENTPCSTMKTVERSPMTNFFTSGIALSPGSMHSLWSVEDPRSIGLGNRYTGIYWAGNLDDAVQGLHYGLAVVSGTHEYGYVGGSLLTYNPNQLGYYGDISYSTSDENLNFTVGMNIGYQPAGLPALSTTDTDSAMMGYNPYVEFTYKNFSLMTEMAIAHVFNGKVRNSMGGHDNCWPVGVNFMPAYRFDDEWEMVFRYSYLDTNGRGTHISTVLLDGANVPYAYDPSISTMFNRLHSYYIGLNWYIMGDSVKLTAGYEYTDFKKGWEGDGEEGVFVGPGAHVNALRARMQLLF